MKKSGISECFPLAFFARSSGR